MLDILAPPVQNSDDEEECFSEDSGVETNSHSGGGQPMQKLMTSLFSEFQPASRGLLGETSGGAVALEMVQPAIRTSLSPSPVGHWCQLIEQANRLPSCSEAWNAIWKEAYEFALPHAESDYHFYLNAAIALSRLKRFNEALLLLLQAEKNGQGDEVFLLAVIKQAAFVLYMKKFYFKSLQLYRSVYGGHAQVSAKLMEYIKEMMHWLRLRPTNEAERIEVNRISAWFDSLTVRPQKTGNCRK